ncbi:MAG: glycyl-radical enzyme activating protein [Nitrososphaerales archaeon]
MTFSIQGFSTEDGPGIRTTVFMKGCGLRCAWCHNPEGLAAEPELMWYDMRCIAAQACLAVCPEDALRLSEQGMEIDRARCDVCGKCAHACPAAALEVTGRGWSVDELLAELLKDEVFYETSDGGVTFSGGEPMLQADFLGELLPRCQEAGLHVALDTCGAVSWRQYERLLSYVALVLLDLKILDRERHRTATGVDNVLIIENARRLAAAGVPLWIRTPIIPGYTDDAANIAAIGAFIRDALPTVERWDLLAYTNLGRPKYHRLGLRYALGDAPLLAAEHMERLLAVALGTVPSARWSGAVRS